MHDEISDKIKAWHNLSQPENNEEALLSRQILQRDSSKHSGCISRVRVKVKINDSIQKVSLSIKIVCEKAFQTGFFVPVAKNFSLPVLVQPEETVCHLYTDGWVCNIINAAKANIWNNLQKGRALITGANN